MRQVLAVLRQLRSTSFITCIAILPALSPCQSQRPPLLWGDLKQGSYPVGFMVLNRRDESRRDSAGSGRPIQISVWYPARNAVSGDAMQFRDYFLLTASQRTLIHPDSAAKVSALRGFSAFLVRAGSSRVASEQWLRSRVAARRNSTRANGRFPIVLVAQGSFESAYSQAILAEFLASNGFVVATSAAPLLLEAEGAPRTSLLELARIQATDLAFVLDQVAAAGLGDSTRTAVVAHSFGARSGFLLTASRHISGLVSLDGGIANRQGRDWLDSAQLDLSRSASPILHFYQDVDGTVTPDFSLLERLTGADRTVVRVDSIYHIDFSSVGFARAAFPGLAVAPPAISLNSKIAAVTELTLSFLKRVTSGDSEPSKHLFQGGEARTSKFLTVRSY
ncbi:MAG TPA: hypothetical protein VM166_09255 [Gemmatimonadaceae bacterium]|nr:hypothetical protein [Gemmatimonadaceae bacterium]